jgi:hypothetical protein
MGGKKSFFKKLKGVKIEKAGFGAKQPGDPSVAHEHRPKKWGGKKVVNLYGIDSTSPDTNGLTVKSEKMRKPKALKKAK